MAYIGVTLELLDQSQQADVADLLCFPAGGLGPPSRNVSIDVWRRGERNVYTGTDISDIVEQIGALTLNRICQKRNYRRRPIPGLDCLLVNMDLELRISPTCTLWDPSSNWSQEERRQRIKQDSSVTGAEFQPRRDQVKAWPTTMVVHLGLEGELHRRDFGPRFCDTLAKSIPKKLVRVGVSGAASFGTETDKGPEVSGYMGGMSHWAKAVPMLGPLFANLFTHLIGPYESCTGLANAIGDARVNVIEVPGDERSFSLGVVYLPADLVTNQTAKTAASLWLVPRNASTAGYRFGSEPGEHLIGNDPYKTLAQVNRMRDDGRLPPTGLSEYFPIIHPKYCEVLAQLPQLIE